MREVDLCTQLIRRSRILRQCERAKIRSEWISQSNWSIGRPLGFLIDRLNTSALFYRIAPCLSPGQMIATCQHNMSQHCWVQHVACILPPCCDMLRHVGYYWLKFEAGQIWANTTQHVAAHRNTVAKRTEHVAPNNVAICCVGMLRSFGRGLRDFPQTKLDNGKKFSFSLKRAQWPPIFSSGIC